MTPSPFTFSLLFLLVVLPCAARTCDKNVPDLQECAQYGKYICTIPERAAYCQRYCGICKDGEKNTQVSNSKEDANEETSCKDTNRLCAFRKASCKNSLVVKSLCKKSCGLCLPSPAVARIITNTHRVIASTSTIKSTERTTPAMTTTVKSTLRTTQKKSEKLTHPFIHSQRRELPPCNPGIPDAITCAFEPDVCAVEEKMMFCQRYCGICPEVPAATTTLQPPTSEKVYQSNVKGPVLAQQPSSAKDSSCVDLTNFLCPMFKCMSDNKEFKKLCEKQTLYICDRQ